MKNSLLRTILLLIIFLTSIPLIAQPYTIPVQVTSEAFSGIDSASAVGEWIEFEVRDTVTNEVLVYVDALFNDRVFDTTFYLPSGSFFMEVLDLGAQVGNPIVILQDSTEIAYRSDVEGYPFTLSYELSLLPRLDTVCTDTLSLEFTSPQQQGDYILQLGTGDGDFSSPVILDTIQSMEDYGVHLWEMDSTLARDSTYSIRLALGDSLFSEAKTVFVSSVTQPVAAFIVPQVICWGDTANFTFSGTASDLAVYHWEFGDGTTATSNTAGSERIYENPGYKTASLRVSDQGCSSLIDTSTFLVHDSLNSTFITNTSLICGSETLQVSFEGAQNDSTVRLWNFSDGDTIGANPDSFSVGWLEFGTKTISLVLEGEGCLSDTTTVTIDFNPKPTATFTTSNLICYQDTATIVYTGTASSTASFAWSLGTNALDTISFDTLKAHYEVAGSQSLSLTVTENGCESDLYEQTLTVNPLLSADFIAPSVICEGDTAMLLFEEMAEGEYLLSWGVDQGQVIGDATADTLEVVWSQPGSQTISLVVQNNGCLSDTAKMDLSVQDPPLSSFSIPTEVCFGATAVIEFTGEMETGSIYEWDLSN
ncbi:MAG: PKD domain-containing protein [Bacteroidota bacterium]